VGPRAVLDAVMIKIPSLPPEIEPQSSSLQTSAIPNELSRFFYYVRIFLKHLRKLS
jgi:hypothetical protein